ncbi:MAG: type II toxin-antitoxin system VapC family toxin [Deltaproteobacteria bacterium]|nr:type II toxin-antitoxin system VapC family toxin [Deltaproteobacteria bacterium]
MRLVDTDVLIWYLRGNRRAAVAIDRGDPFCISAVTYIELVQGMRNRDELRALRRALQSWGARVLHVDTEISARALYYVEQHFLAHAVRLADALVAATAVCHGLALLTANVRHYRALGDVELALFRP